MRGPGPPEQKRVGVAAKEGLIVDALAAPPAPATGPGPRSGIGREQEEEGGQEEGKQYGARVCVCVCVTPRGADGGEEGEGIVHSTLRCWCHAGAERPSGRAERR